MQCPNCKFHNMPGSVVCGRCSSTLNANTLTIDIHPPRASSLAKRFRRLFGSPTLYRARDVAQQAHADFRASMNRQGFEVPPVSSLPRMVVPGWPLLHVGERTSGWIYFGTSLFLLFLGILFIGTGIGSICLGLAFAVHVGSCLAFLRQGGCEPRAMRRVGLGVFAALLLGLYLPVGWLVSRVAMPLTLNVAATPFAAGDVLLLNQLAFSSSPPIPGDVVLHRQPAQLLHMRAYPNYMIAEGDAIDRVLARPGDQVRWEKGNLWVNGEESSVRPLNPQLMPEKQLWTVPPGQYLIVPTASLAITPVMPAEAWQQVSLVRADDILGRVYFRTGPLSRWGRIR